MRHRCRLPEAAVSNQGRFPIADVAAAAGPLQAKWRSNDTIAALSKDLTPLCQQQQQGPLHAPLHALAVLFAMKNRPKLQALVYDILPSRKVPESDAWSVESTLAS